MVVVMMSMLIMMVMVMMMLVILMLMVVMMLVLVFIVMMVLVLLLFVMMMLILFFLLFAVSFGLNLLNPAGRGSYGLPIKLMGIDDEVEIYNSVVALKDFCLRLDGADNLLQMLQLLRLYFCRLVQQDDVAELHLLDNE